MSPFFVYSISWQRHKTIHFCSNKKLFLINNNLQTDKYNPGKIEFFLFIKFLLLFHFRKVIVKVPQVSPTFLFRLVLVFPLFFICLSSLPSSFFSFLFFFFHLFIFVCLQFFPRFHDPHPDPQLCNLWISNIFAIQVQKIWGLANAFVKARFVGLLPKHIYHFAILNVKNLSLQWEGVNVFCSHSIHIENKTSIEQILFLHSRIWCLSKNYMI